ncbi:MAG: TlpA family protein disulfide reductase [Bacteroidaceae bacterium]|nr:TlpA family protein disulfide reductase [Bacteroidaceae bacterium]
MTLQASPEQLRIGGDLFYQQSQQLKDTMKPASEAIQTAYDHYRSISMDKTIQNRDSALENAARVVTEKQNAFMHTIQDYYAAHKSDEGCVVSLVQTLRDEKYYEGADPSVKNGQFKTYLEKYVSQQQKARADREAREKAASEAASKSAVGQMFTDFQAEFDGKTYKLSDYVGRGKYVLVDFWASWCGPCKAEIPNLIKVYNQYKGDKFEVLGVATWDEPKASLKTIEQMKIPYPQILNAQRAGSDAYGITGIPQIILFGPDGTILKRDLRGEQIEATIKELLK